MSESPITPKLFRFLADLSRHNDRDWFAEHKSRYEQDVREPALELIRRLEQPLARAAPMLEAVDKKTGGSLMRIYRDTRFAKDKTPYKTNVGISLRHQGDRDIHAPGIYIHLASDECFLGAGCWRPERSVLAAIRTAIDDDPQGWKRALAGKAFRSNFALAGESLKTSPRDYPKDHPLIEDLRRVDFIAVSPVDREEFFADDVVKRLIDRIKAAQPLMSFLCGAVGVPY